MGIISCKIKPGINLKQVSHVINVEDISFLSWNSYKLNN